ncbi:MAG: sensor histidine kinase [Aureisphaera sp.]
MIHLVLILSTGSLYAQKKPWKELDLALKTAKYEKAELILNGIDSTQLKSSDRGRFHYYSSQLMVYEDKHDKAFEDARRSVQFFLENEEQYWLGLAYNQVYEVLSHQHELKIDKEFYLNEFIKVANNTQHPELLSKKHLRLGNKFLKVKNGNQALVEYRKSITYLGKAPNKLSRAKIMFNMATAFQYTHPKPQLDSSLTYLRHILTVFERYDHKDYIAYNYSNQIVVLNKLERYKEAEIYSELRNNVKLAGKGNKAKLIFMNNGLRTAKSRRDFEKALYFAEEKFRLDSIIEDESQNNAITEAEAKYQTAEKEKQLLISEQQKTQNRNIALGLGGGLATVSIFAFLVYKNTRRKQRIAEQEKELEIQKKEKILKDQELNAIDAMIEGQEKERQRLASDLHDSVGATLSAAKLQFDHIAKNRDKLEELEELFEKTGSLLEEAYTEVRSMAHLKNSGVIASKGLLPAVEKLAKNASNSTGLQIEVQDFGLHEKLEASLEIAIFRIIQELVTNIIKHAEATEAHISITQHEDMLNIIVEDNGRGFNPRKMKKAEGMGLHGIEKRVEHLEGSLEVDAAIGRGTNILIDIPL